MPIKLAAAEVGSLCVARMDMDPWSRRPNDTHMHHKMNAVSEPRMSPPSVNTFFEPGHLELAPEQAPTSQWPASARWQPVRRSRSSIWRSIR